MGIMEIARERSPTAKAVNDRPGSCAAFWYPFTLYQQPGVQGIGYRSILLLADILALVGVERLHLALTVIEHTGQFQCFSGDLAAVINR